MGYAAAEVAEPAAARDVQLPMQETLDQQADESIATNMNSVACVAPAVRVAPAGPPCPLEELRHHGAKDGHAFDDEGKTLTSFGPSHPVTGRLAEEKLTVVHGKVQKVEEAAVRVETVLCDGALHRDMGMAEFWATAQRVKQRIPHLLPEFHDVTYDFPAGKPLPIKDRGKDHAGAAACKLDRWALTGEKLRLQVLEMKMLAIEVQRRLQQTPTGMATVRQISLWTGIRL